MPIVIKYLPANTNTTVTFEFGATVYSYVVGVSYWKFVFGGTYPWGGGPDHHVAKLELNVTGSRSGQQVRCTVAGNLQDGSGASIDHERSSVNLVCIAVTDSDDGNYAMSQVDGVRSGTSAGNLALTTTALSIEQAFLSGWSLAYTGDDHHMKSLQLGADFARNGNTGQLRATARMADDSGHATDGSASAGLLAASMSQTALLVRALPQSQSTGVTSVDFGKKIKSAGVLLQSLSLAFSGDDHHIREIGGGTSSYSWKGSVLTLADSFAFMSDSSGHKQSDSSTASHVNLVAFAAVNV